MSVCTFYAILYKCSMFQTFRGDVFCCGFMLGCSFLCLFIFFRLMATCDMSAARFWRSVPLHVRNSFECGYATAMTSPTMTSLRCPHCFAPPSHKDPPPSPRLPPTPPLPYTAAHLLRPRASPLINELTEQRAPQINLINVTITQQLARVHVIDFPVRNSGIIESVTAYCAPVRNSYNHARRDSPRHLVQSYC